MTRLALHVHGDDAARAHEDALVSAIAGLQDGGIPLSLEDLNARIKAIAGEYGLTGYASNAKCISDPLDTIVDVSLYARPG